MLVNGFKSTNYSTSGESLFIQLICSVDEALSMNTNVITVTTDQGTFVERFVGYLKVSATVDAVTEEVTLKCVKDNSETLTSLIKANEDSTSRLDTVENAIVELAMLMG